LNAALDAGQPFAAGRIGISEKHWLYYPILLERGMQGIQKRVFESRLRYQAESQVGIFPGSPEFLLEYNQFYVEAVRELSVLGLVFDTVLDPEIESHYEWRQPIAYYKDLEPDMSIPARPENCFLPSLAGKKLLLVCPFADLLAERAQKQTFEAVWSRTGRRWFKPAAVEALTCPYGIAADTRTRYGSALDIYDELAEKMNEIDFDVAFIAVGGLSIPLVAHARRIGRTAIHFGGKIQVLFGVIGARWRERPRWRDRIFNDAWIDMPERYRPPEADQCNNSAYW
jgi:hypothetical protein